ncbi:hypothetical protein EON83_00145 [bacterium]|nr:MAG: hypothetical protein EON83_00145 [bacterium]
MPLKTQAPPARLLDTQGTLPFKRKSKGRAVKVLEKVVEVEADFELSRASFPFLNTTVRFPFINVVCPNPRCGRCFRVRPNNGTGQDKGIPDRLVYSRAWWHPLLPSTLWLGVELKGSHTPFSSPEQKLLFESGHTVVARSGQSALDAARRTDAFFAHVEALESKAAALLSALREKGGDWRERARELSAQLRAGAGDIDEILSE